MITEPMDQPDNNSSGERIGHLPNAEELADAMRQLQASHPGLLIVLEPVAAWVVMTALHVALHHPKFSSGGPRDVVEGIAGYIRKSIAPDGLLAAWAESSRWEEA